MERISPLRLRQRKAGGKFQSPIFCARSCRTLSIPDICLTLTKDYSLLPSTFSLTRWIRAVRKPALSGYEFMISTTHMPVYLSIRAVMHLSEYLLASVSAQTAGTCQQSGTACSNCWCYPDTRAANK